MPNQTTYVYKFGLIRTKQISTSESRSDPRRIIMNQERPVKPQKRLLFQNKKKKGEEVGEENKKDLDMCNRNENQKKTVDVKIAVFFL